MKAIKNILLLLLLSCSTCVWAYDYSEYGNVCRVNPPQCEAPSMEFHSTSSLPLSGSQLPSAIATGVTFSESGTTAYTTGPSRVNPDGGHGDPSGNGTPIGDIPWLLMALLVGGYALRVGKRLPTRASRHRR